MAITVVVKSTIIDNVSSIDTAIATLLNAAITITAVYSVTIVPISNTQSRVIMVYS
jgi:hypothetical protein